MKTYDLYLDSGPMKKKTYVHVPQLLGCIARGDTSDAAVENAPAAIRAFLAFCARSGERIGDAHADIAGVVDALAGAGASTTPAISACASPSTSRRTSGPATAAASSRPTRSR